MARSAPTLTVCHRHGQQFVSVPALKAVLRTPREEAVSCSVGLEPVIVGADDAADLTAADARLSRRHCSLQLTADGVLLKDLGSKNGVFISGVRIREAYLAPGASALVGGSTLTCEEDGPPREVPLWPEPQFRGAIGMSTAMRALFAHLARAARTEDPILLLGESGTGKDLLARAIHDESPRGAGPFVVFDCAAVSPDLIEAELFGYEKGAFTGAGASRAGLAEAANGGTLFLDEIGELPLDLQPRLLRLLEEKEVRRVGGREVRRLDVRIVAATHRNLAARVSAGSFRRDLYFRLSIFEARVPPLRDRREDIPSLAERVLASLRPPKTLGDLPTHSLDMLQAHEWPGNVRELRNVVTRLALLPDMDPLMVRPSDLRKAPERLDGLGALPLRDARDAAVDRFEREYLRLRLSEHRGDVPATAKAIGASRPYLERMMKRYGLKVEELDG